MGSWGLASPRSTCGQQASDYKPRHVLTQPPTCWPAWLPSYKMEPESAAWHASLSPKELGSMTDGRFPEVIFNRLPFTRIKSCDVSGKNPPWTRLPPGSSLPPAQSHRWRATNARTGVTGPQQAFLNHSQQMHAPAPPGAGGSPAGRARRADGTAASPLSTWACALGRVTHTMPCLSVVSPWEQSGRGGLGHQLPQVLQCIRLGRWLQMLCSLQTSAHCTVLK